jgi:hypothetical protein
MLSSSPDTRARTSTRHLQIVDDVLDEGLRHRYLRRRRLDVGVGLLAPGEGHEGKKGERVTHP